MKLESKNIPLYLGFFLVVVVVSQLGNKVGDFFEKQKDNDEYDLIRKYLLNDNPLTGYNKPKLWIHTKYEKNSRFCRSFHSRCSYDLNQPYIHLCVKSIIDHCGDDFNICLIDDDSFSKLIPDFNTKIDAMVEPFKTNMREYAMSLILYSYGGLFVPNSFVCLKNLNDLYDRGISQNKPFLLENINYGHNTKNGTRRMTFVPDLAFMGCQKNDPSMRQLLDYLKSRNLNPHFSSEEKFFKSTSNWIISQVNLNRFSLIGGELIGTKTSKMKPILLEDLMEEQYLDLHPQCYGVFIPNDQLLNRIKYQWFPNLSCHEVLRTTTVLTKYLKASMVNAVDVEIGETQIIKSQILSF